MKLLTGTVDKWAKGRALKMLAAGGVMLAVLWAMTEPAPIDEVVVAGSGPGPGETRAPSAQLSFAPRKVAENVTNLFSGHSWFVPPPPPPPVAPQAPAPPSAPPLPFTVLGSYASSGGVPVYFLVKGDSVYDVRIGDVVDNTYSVDDMTNGQLHLTYLPLKISQSLPVGSAP